MSSPSNGILKTAGVSSHPNLNPNPNLITSTRDATATDNNTTTTNIASNHHSNNSSNKGDGNHISHKKQTLGVTPSVQFSEDITRAGHNGARTTNADDGDASRGMIQRTIDAFLATTRGPLISCRAMTLKIIHCRITLMIICALVVVECACVMSELMVDLHGIKLRFDNEAEEINKFVAHFRNQHPDAFRSVELRRMQDLMHLLKTSTTPASMDAALCGVCSSSSSSHHTTTTTNTIDGTQYAGDRKGLNNDGIYHAGNHKELDDNNIHYSTMLEIPTTRGPSLLPSEATRVANLQNISQQTVSSSNNIGVDSPEVHRSKTISPTKYKGGDKKLSAIEIMDQNRNNQTPLRMNNADGTESTGPTRSNSITQTSHNSKGVNKNDNSIKNSNQIISSNAAENGTSGSNKQTPSDEPSLINNKSTSESSFYVTTTEPHTHTSSASKDEMTPLSNYVATDTNTHTAKHYNQESKLMPTTPPSLLKSSQPRSQNNPQPVDNGIAGKQIMMSKADSGGGDVLAIDHSYNEFHVPFSKENNKVTENRSVSLKQSHSRHKVFEENQYNFINDSGAASPSTSLLMKNLFVLAINNVKENFFLIAEVLPNHVKTNGSLHSRYMDEYKSVYKTSKALHYTSLTILGIMVTETIVKLFCTGCRFFKKKLEVFDAVIVILSFSLDVMFLDSRWYETGKDATALLVLLLPWRVVRIVNSFVMTIKHKHHIQMMNLKRGKKKAELKTAKVQSLLKEIRKDVQLLVTLCKSANVDENSINACLYGKGRNDGVTQTLIETCASLVLISTLGKNPRPQEDDIYGTLIQEALEHEGVSTKSPEKQQEEEAAIDAAIALDDKIEAKRKSSKRKPSLSIRLQKALLTRSHTIPRRCASLEIPDAQNGMDLEGAENNVFYLHEDSGDIVPEGDYVIIDGDGRYYIRDIILPDGDGGSHDCDGASTGRARSNTCSEL